MVVQERQRRASELRQVDEIAPVRKIALLKGSRQVKPGTPVEGTECRKYRDRRLSYTGLTDARLSYAMLNQLGHLIEPVDDYLDYLTATGTSERVARGLGYDLKDFWVYLHQLDISVEEVSTEDLENWIDWLRLPSELRFASDHIVLLGVAPTSNDTVVSRKLSTVVGFLDYMYRVRGDIERLPYRRGADGDDRESLRNPVDGEPPRGAGATPKGSGDPQVELTGADTEGSEHSTSQRLVRLR
jgi:hypothetical protein